MFYSVERLSKGRFQDVLEFCQWLMRYFNNNVGTTSRPGYDPVARRGGHGGGGAASDHPSTAESSHKGASSYSALGQRSPRRGVKSAGMQAKAASASHGGAGSAGSSASAADHAKIAV